MNCEKAQDLFSGYMEGALNAKESADFEQHLTDCPLCKEDYSRFNASLMLVEELPEVDIPSGFHSRVMIRLQRENAARPERVRRFKLDWQHVFTVRVPARALATAFAVLLLFVMVAQLTPVGNMIGAGLPWNRASNEKLVGSGVDDDYAPQAWPVTGSKETPGSSGPSISVKAITAGTNTTSYALTLMADKGKSARVDIYRLRGESDKPRYSIYVPKGRQSVVSVDASKPTVLKVVWEENNADRTDHVFLPASFNKDADKLSLDISMQNESVFSILSKISTSYGIVVVGSGDLSANVASFIVEDGDPSEAVYRCTALSNLSFWKELEPSVYSVGSAK